MRTVCIPKKPSGDSDGSKRAYFVLIYGDPLGEVFQPSKKKSIFGRDEEADFVIEDSSISRMHAEVISDKDQVILKDLKSTNGTFVNDVKIDEVLLQDGDRIRMGRSYLRFSFTDVLEEEFYKDFFRIATCDGLTSTINKTYSMELLERELARSQRYKRPLSVMMLDIDHFKKVNDTFGHLAGDYVLRELAKIINAHLRAEDLFGRYGGEEFLIVLPDLPIKKGCLVADKIRALIEEKEFVFSDQVIPVTISIGITEARKNSENAKQLIAQADENLYIAKAQGRNRVCDGR